MNNPAYEPEESRQGDQYLTFVLTNEEYALEIMKVQEIKSWESATPIPCSAPHILGVINLRGAIVPIVELRLQFALPSYELGGIRAVIIVRCEIAGQDRTVGLLVDKVSEVYHLDRDNIQPCSDISTVIGGDYVRGLVQLDNSLLILVNLEQILHESLELIDKANVDTGGSSDE